MPEITIHSLDLTDRKQVNAFIRLPFRLYRGCPQWVPPLLSEARQSLDPNQHPFYQHSQADFFLAERAGRVVGRLAVMHNQRHSQYTGRKAAFFGFFDCEDDRQAAQALFEAAFRWARDRGLNEMIGPRGLLGSDAGGVLVHGFEHRAALNIPYNYAYYDPLVTAAGFERDSDSLSGYLSGDSHLDERVERIAARVKQRRGLSVRSFTTKDEMKSWIPRVAAVYNDSFIENHEFFPLTEAEIAMMGESLIAIADPQLIKLVMHGEQVVGFVFAYHDLSPALQKSGGRLFPVGWIYILQERRRAEWVNIHGIGLLPEFQRLGGDALLFSELAHTLIDFGFKKADIVMVNDKNIASRSDLEAIGIQWYKTHRNYRRWL